MDIDLPLSWKQRAADLTELGPVKWVLSRGIQALVPRQRIGVALVAFNSRDQLFMLKHVFHPGAPWGLPGGWLGRNEDPAKGVVRELKEETGLTVTIGPPAYVAYGSVPNHIGIAYSGHIHDGLLKLNSEILEARWFDLDDLPGPLHPFTIKAIDAARRTAPSLEA